MPATITSQFRKNNAKNLIANSFATDQSYWIGIGKSDEWPAAPTAGSLADISIPYPNSSVDYSAVTLENLISLKKSVGANNVTTKPRLMVTANVWAVGRKYKIYDSGNDECFIPKAVAGGTTVDLYPCHTSVISGSKEYFFLCLGVFKAITTGLDPVTTAESNPYDQFNKAEANGGYGSSFFNTFDGIGKMVNTDEGYRWVYLYSLSITDTFNTNHFKCLPVDNSGNALVIPSITAEGHCANIFAIRIDNAGTDYTDTEFKIILHYSGYTIADTAVTGSVSYSPLSGGLTNDTIRRTLSSYIKTAGTLTYISAPKIPTTVKFVTRATISIITAGAANVLPMLLTPIVTSIDAIKDLSSILPCWYVGFYAKFDPNADLSRPFSQPSDIITKNEYRQISLIRNPISTISANINSADNNDNSMDCLRYFVMTSDAVVAITDLSLKIYQCNISGNLLGSTATESETDLISAVAHLDYINRVAVSETVTVTRVYFHQNYTAVNVKNFAATGHIKFGSDNNTAYQYTCIDEPEYKRGTGEVLFIENRHFIARNTNQAEEIRLIIQL